MNSDTITNNNDNAHHRHHTLDINNAMSSMNDCIRHLTWVKSDFAAIRQAESTFAHQSTANATATTTSTTTGATTKTPAYTGFSFDTGKLRDALPPQHHSFAT
jgi:hypothetical protein